MHLWPCGESERPSCHRSPSARAGDLWRSMARPSSPGEVDTPLPTGTVRHRDAKSGTVLHKGVGGWKRRIGHRSPTVGWRSLGDLWCFGPWVAGLLSTWLPLEQVVAAGDQANSIGPLWSPAPFLDGDRARSRRGVPLFARVPMAKCQWPSAKFQVALKCQVPTWHSRARCQVNLALVHTAALSGTGKQRPAPSGTTRPVSGMAAVVQGRPPSHIGGLTPAMDWHSMVPRICFPGTDAPCRRAQQRASGNRSQMHTTSQGTAVQTCAGRPPGPSKLLRV
jgi:hypothetical protein